MHCVYVYGVRNWLHPKRDIQIYLKILTEVYPVHLRTHHAFKGTPIPQLKAFQFYLRVSIFKFGTTGPNLIKIRSYCLEAKVSNLCVVLSVSVIGEAEKFREYR